MTYIRSAFRHSALLKIDLGYTVDYYDGSLSTLCAVRARFDQHVSHAGVMRDEHRAAQGREVS